MLVTAYVLKAAGRVVRRVCGPGAQIYLSPPYTMADPPPADAFEQADVIYLRLHGWSGQPYAYNAQRVTALSAEQVQAWDLRGVRLAILGNCYEALANAFRAAGCKYVVYGKGKNYGSRWVYMLSGVDLFTKEVVDRLKENMDVRNALTDAFGAVEKRMRVHRRIPFVGQALAKADKDVLDFHVYGEPYGGVV